jgi:hypothetical protein
MPLKPPGLKLMTYVVVDGKAVTVAVVQWMGRVKI